MDSHDLSFRMLGVNVSVNCPVGELRAMIQANWGHMNQGDMRADVKYCVNRNEHNSPISIARTGQPTKWTADEGQFLYELEGDVNVALQTFRPDLYFLHAAVAEVNGVAILLVAESGGGKSTTLWGLLHHGWGYMSDELAPIDLASLQVHAYPRALCVKRQPPAAYPLPAETIETSRTFHVPVDHLPRVSQLESCPLGAVYFVKYHSTASHPVIREITAGEAGARLYANGLNQLAHSNAGLDAAVGLAKSIPSFALDTADLASTCDLVASRTF